MKGTPLTEETYEYIVQHFASDEASLLERMEQRAREKGVPMIMISPDQAKFLRVLVQSVGAKRVLEVGTLFGYSAAALALGVAPVGGSVVSLEFSPVHAAVARENLASEGITNVEVVEGNAVETIRGFKTDSFDFALIDADKANYIAYFEECLRVVRSGGVILADNALAWGKVANASLPETDEDWKSVTSIQAFNAAASRVAGFLSSLVPIGDGMVMGVVK